MQDLPKLSWPFILFNLLRTHLSHEREKYPSFFLAFEHSFSNMGSFIDSYMCTAIASLAGLDVLPSYYVRVPELHPKHRGDGEGGPHDAVSYTHLTLPTNREV